MEPAVYFSVFVCVFLFLCVFVCSFCIILSIIHTNRERSLCVWQNTLCGRRVWDESLPPGHVIHYPYRVGFGRSFLLGSWMIRARTLECCCLSIKRESDSLSCSSTPPRCCSPALGITMREALGIRDARPFRFLLPHPFKVASHPPSNPRPSSNHLGRTGRATEGCHRRCHRSPPSPPRPRTCMVRR